MKKWMTALVLSLVFCLVCCVALADGKTLPDARSVENPRIVVKGQTTAISTPTGSGYEAIKLVIKDTNGWPVTHVEVKNVSVASNGKLNFSVNTGTNQFTAGHLYLTELFALPTLNCDPEKYELFWSSILTVVPVNASGLQIYMNNSNVETGYDALFVTAYDPNAENVWIVLDGEPFQNRPGNNITWVQRFDETGNHTVSAISMDAEGKKTVYSGPNNAFTVIKNSSPELYSANETPVTFTMGNETKSLDKFPETVTAGTDIVYTIHRVTKNLGQDSQGLDEQIWYDSWLDDLTDWSSSIELPCYEKRYEPEVGHGPLLNETTGDRTITISSTDLITGHMYQLNVEIKSAGCTPVIYRKGFMVLPANMNNQGITLKFTGDNANNDAIEMPVFEDFDLVASAPGATIIRFWNGNRFEYFPGDKANFTHKTWSTGINQYFVQAYYGEINGTPWDMVAWDAARISNILTVYSVKDDASQTVFPTYSALSNTVTRGEYYTVTLTNTDELNQPGVYVGANLYNGNDIQNHFDRTGNKIMVPTADLWPGYYILEVYTETTGAGHVMNPHCFRVVADQNTPDDRFIITTTVPEVNGKRNVESFENFGVTLFAPDMEGYSKYYRFNDGQRWWSDRWYERSLTIDPELEPGTWEIYAEVVYEPFAQGKQEIRYESEHISITANSRGYTTIRPQGAGIYLKGGGGYTISIVDTSTDQHQLIDPSLYKDEYWEVELREADGPEQIRYSREEGQNLENKFTFNDDCFEPGKIYEIRFHLNILGYDPVDEEICFMATDSTESSNSLQLFVNDSNAVSAGPFNAHTMFNVSVVKAAGITAVRVLRDGRWEIWRGDIFEDEWGLGVGTYGIVAQGTTDDAVWEEDGFDWGNFDWNRDVKWTITSNTVTVNINASEGRLASPVLSLDKRVYTRGETITATVGKVSGTEWYDLKALPVDEYGNEDWDHSTRLHMDMDGNGEGTFDFFIRTTHMEPGHYRVSVDNNGTGYAGNSSPAVEFEIVAGSQAPKAVLELPAQIKTNENIRFYAYVPGADDIWVNIRKQGELGWRQDRDEGRAFAEWEFGEAFKGTYIFTLYGHVNGKEVLAAGPVQMEVKADSGNLKDVKITVDENNIVTIGGNGASNGISGSFVRDSNAQWYQVRLVYRGPDGVWDDDEIKSDFRTGTSISNTFSYDKTDFKRGKGVYEICVIGGATGYNGTDNRYRIIAEEQTSKSIAMAVYSQNGTTGQTLNVQANESLTVRITAPNATAIRLFDGERWEWWDGRCLNKDGWAEFGWSHDSGEYDFVAQASYDKGYDWETFNDWDHLQLNWTATSNKVHVSVSADGTTDLPVIANIDRVTRGELVEVTVTGAGAADSPSRATRLDVRLQNEDGRDIGDGFGVDVINTSDYPYTFQLPTGNMEPGLYYACVYSHASGYNTSWAYAAFEVEEPENDSFILEVQDDLIAERNFSVSAYSEGASWIELCLQEREDENPFSWGPFEGDHIYNTKGKLDGGEYEIWAVAHYKNEHGQETGTKISQRVVRDVNWMGVLEEPVIHAQNAYSLSEGISFTVEGLNQRGWWWVELFDTDSMVPGEDGENVWERVHRWDMENPIEDTFTYSNGLKAGHTYHIYAGVDEEGYQNQGANWNALVYDEKSNDIALEVEEDAGYTLNHWPSSRNMRITVKAKSSSAIRLWVDDHWECYDCRTMDAEGNYPIELNYHDARTYTIVAQASYDKKPDNTAYDWDEVDFSQFDLNNELRWTKTSNSVSVTVYADGQLDAPEFTAPVAAKRGSDIVIRITKVLDGQWYGAHLRHLDGENVSDFINMDENNIITIPTEHVDSGLYDLCIWTDKEGMLGHEIRQEILIENLAGAAVFTLPSYITTVDADAFDGVSMTVVVLQGNHRNLDLSFLNDKDTRYLVAGDGDVIVPNRHSYIVITQDQYSIVK